MIHRFAFQENTGNTFTDVHPSFRTEIEQQNPLVQLHDPESADLRMARQSADETIHVSGAEVKVYIRTDNADYDSVWDEDPDPTYWNVVLMKAFFKPQPLESELKKFGPDVGNKLEIVFSHRELYERFGQRMLRTGDVIQVPYNAANIRPKNYRVLNGTPTGNYRYHWMYFTCMSEILTADITVRPEEDITPADGPLDDGGYLEG